MATPEFPRPEFKPFRPELQKTLESLLAEMPDDSWSIETQLFTQRTFIRELQERLRPQFLPGNPRGRRMDIIFPKTMAVGLFKDGAKVTKDGFGIFALRKMPAPIRVGLFSTGKNERYNPNLIREYLEGDPSDVVSHEMVDLSGLTHRPQGFVSPILDEAYLRNFSLIDFSPWLTHILSRQDAIAVYSLGFGSGSKPYYLSARGTDFLPAYQAFADGLGVRNNLTALNAEHTPS